MANENTSDHRSYAQGNQPGAYVVLTLYISRQPNSDELLPDPKVYPIHSIRIQCEIHQSRPLSDPVDPICHSRSLPTDDYSIQNPKLASNIHHPTSPLLTHQQMILPRLFRLQLLVHGIPST